MKKQRQSIPTDQRYSRDDFRRQFPNDDSCLAYIKEQRWPNGVTICDSKQCDGVERKHHRVTGRTAYACDHCGKHIYPLAGTIFEKTSTPLHKWFEAMFLMGATRCGISAKQIQREIVVTYKTAWRIAHQLRKLLSEDLQLEGLSVEIDEMYVGGVRKYGVGRPMVGDKKKTPVMGMVERGGRVVALTLPNVKGSTLLGHIRERVLPYSMIFTDELNAYDGIKHMPNGYNHRRIKHSAGVYVRGNVHTNTIEGFWSLVKRGIGGVYHSVSQKHLQSYLDEYSFRYNRRDVPQPMFASILQQVSLKTGLKSPSQEASQIPVESNREQEPF